MKTLYFILLIIIIPSLVFTQDRQSDSLALIQIYNDLEGDLWTNNENWLSNTPLDDWNGITMDNNRVSKVRLFNIGVGGTFSDAFYDLTALTSIDLLNGNTTGEITTEIYNLTELRILALANLDLSGTVPDLDNMPELDNIRLNGNNFSGGLPAIPHNSSLVRMGSNNFTGTIPDSWSENQLTVVDISSNNLEGTIDIFNTFPNIRGLDVDGNNWDEGPLPEWLDDIPSLINFFGSEANFVGDIPEYDFSNSPNFDQIIVNSNQLTGDISNLANGVNNPLWLDAKNNLLEGELPIDKFQMVARFNLSNNNFSTLADPNAPLVYEITLSGNAFKISTLLPHLNEFPIDSLSTLRYNNQRSIFEQADTTLQTPQIFTLDAGDDYDGMIYQWTRNNQEIEGANSKTLDVDATQMSSLIGRYNCIMTHPDLIDNQGNMVEFERGDITLRTDFTSSTKDELYGDINIFPNPTTDQLIISFSNIGDKTKYTLYTMEGKIVRSKRIHSQITTINIRDLQKGNYYLNITEGNRITTRKISKL